MSKAKDFAKRAQAAVAAGRPLIVEVKPTIEELGQENVLDPHMRGRVIGVLTDYGFGDEAIYQVKIDLTEFMVYNSPFEKANWFGEGDRLVKARGTKNWPSNNIDELWLGANEDPESYLEVLENGEAYREYRDSGFEGSYIEWLELQVENLRRMVRDKDNYIQDLIAKEPLQLRDR